MTQDIDIARIAALVGEAPRTSRRRVSHFCATSAWTFRACSDTPRPGRVSTGANAAITWAARSAWRCTGAASIWGGCGITSTAVRSA